jgi:DNA invertase Pin-like site-specific DNA recombinase
VTDSDRSASRYAKRARDGYQDALTAIRSHSIDVLVAWEASRAQRDLSAYVTLRAECERHNVLYAYSGRVYDLSRADDRFSTALDALLAEREVDATRDRILRTVRIQAEAGRPHGRIPFGYRREYDSETGALIGQFIDDKQATVVREAVDRVLAGETLRAVCRDFNARRIPSPRRPRADTPEEHVVRVWEPLSLRQILIRPAIAGLRQYRGEIIGLGSWPAIVREDEWRRMRAQLTDPSRRTTTHRGVAPTHLLTNIAECGLCGQRLKMFSDKRRTNYRGYVCRAEGCMGVAASEPRVDEIVVDTLLAYLARSDVRAAVLAAHRSAQDTKADPVLLELERLRGRLDEAAQQYAVGEISAAMLGRVEARLAPQLEKLERTVAHHSAPTPEVAGLLTAADLHGAWQRLEAAGTEGLIARREIIRALFRVSIYPSSTKGRRFDADRVRISPKPVQRV